MPGGDFGVPDGGLRLPAPPSGVSTTSQAAAAAKELRRNQRKLDGNNKRTVTSSKVFGLQVVVTFPLIEANVSFAAKRNCTAVFEGGAVQVTPSPKGYWAVTADFTINDDVGGLFWSAGAAGGIGTGAGGSSSGTSFADIDGPYPLTLSTQWEGYLGGTLPLLVGALPAGVDPPGTYTAFIAGHLITEGFPV